MNVTSMREITFAPQKIPKGFSLFKNTIFFYFALNQFTFGWFLIFLLYFSAIAMSSWILLLIWNEIRRWLCAVVAVVVSSVDNDNSNKRHSHLCNRFTWRFAIFFSMYKSKQRRNETIRFGWVHGLSKISLASCIDTKVCT